MAPVQNLTKLSLSSSQVSSEMGDVSMREVEEEEEEEEDLEEEEKFQQVERKMPRRAAAK